MRKLFTIILTAGLIGGACSTASAILLLPSQAALTAAPDTVKKKVSSKSKVHIQNNGNSNGNHLYINTDEGKRLELKYKGDIALTEDLKGIKSISPGGYLKYMQTVNNATKRLEIQSDSKGNLTHTYAVNGEKVAYEPQGRQWLQEIMPDLMATTGIGVEEQVRELYSKSGAKGVLSEAAKAPSEYGKNRYLNLLLEQPNLKPADVKDVLQFSSKHINSDYERSKTLRKVSKQNLANKEVVAAYLGLTGAISSDYERGKALSYLLENTELNSDTLNKVVATTSKMDSDYEKNKVLKKIIEHPAYLKGGFDGSLQIISNYSSDYEKAKALTSIVGKHKLSNEQYQAMLPIVSDIDSDYEKSKVLRVIAIKIPANATALREQYIKTAQTINSEYESKKALDALAKNK